jgi:S-adenosylmethionine synthetase
MLPDIKNGKTNYRFLALDPAYEYAEVAAQYSERVQVAMAYTVGKEASPGISTAINLLGYSRIVETLRRLVQNYSDEEMAMLAFYVMFQLEEDSKLLQYYRAALEDWWVSIKV